MRSSPGSLIQSHETTGKTAEQQKKCCVLKLIKNARSVNLCVSRKNKKKKTRNYEKKISDYSFHVERSLISQNSEVSESDSNDEALNSRLGPRHTDEILTVERVA